MAKSKRISLIIPSNSSAKKLKPLLESVAAQSMSLDHFEVIISFNGREPLDNEEQKWIENYSKNISLSILQNEHPGVNRARNLGADIGEGEVLYFLDDDCYLSRGNQLELAYQKVSSTEMSLHGGPYLLSGNHHLDDFYNRMCNLWVESHRDTEGDYHYLLGGNFAIAHCVFKEFRFDEDLLWGGEETEFFQRIHQKNLSVNFTKDLAVFHTPGKTKRTLFDTARRQGRGKARLNENFYNRDWIHFAKVLEFTDLKKAPLGGRYAYEVFRSYLRNRLRVSNPFFNPKG